MLAIMSSQHLFATLFLLLGLSSAPAFAARDMLWENEEYIGQNLRPSNITGLYSWMYGWIGSYVYYTRLRYNEETVLMGLC